jgi:hypothetical protein
MWSDEGKHIYDVMAASLLENLIIAADIRMNTYLHESRVFGLTGELQMQGLRQSLSKQKIDASPISCCRRRAAATQRVVPPGLQKAEWNAAKLCFVYFTSFRSKSILSCGINCSSRQPRGLYQIWLQIAGQ